MADQKRICVMVKGDFEHSSTLWFHVVAITCASSVLSIDKKMRVKMQIRFLHSRCGRICDRQSVGHGETPTFNLYRLISCTYFEVYIQPDSQFGEVRSTLSRAW